MVWVIDNPLIILGLRNQHVDELIGVCANSIPRVLYNTTSTNKYGAYSPLGHATFPTHYDVISIKLM